MPKYLETEAGVKHAGTADAVQIRSMRFKRTASLLCAAGMAFAAAGCVRAEDASSGCMTDVFNALSDLMLKTENVTLDLSADFSYDGVLFKSFRGHLVQDGTRSTIDAGFTTRRPNGSTYDTSWKTHAVDEEVWYYNSFDGEYYSSTWTDPCGHVLNLDESDELLVRMAGSAMELVDLAAPSLSSMTEGTDGKEIALSLNREQVPGFLNELTAMLIRKAASRYMSVSIDSFDTEDGIDEDGRGAEVWYEDDFALFKRMLSAAAGRELTDDECYELQNSDASLSEQAYSALWELETEACGKYDSGYVYIYADGTYAWYPTMEEMAQKEEIRWLEYEDWDAAFIRYLKETTGETLTQNELSAIYWSDNAELWSAYKKLSEQMDVSYMDRLGEHPMGYVLASGELQYVDDVTAYYTVMDESEASIAYSALVSMRQVRLGDSEMTARFDAQGRLTGVSGKVVMDFISSDGSAHPVEIAFTASASAYGESAVGEFDPEEWGVVPFLEYYGDWEYDEGDEVSGETYPETVTLNGVTYPVSAE